MGITSSYPQLLGVVGGLSYLHSCNVIHGDLKGVYDITYPGIPLADGDKHSQVSWSIHQETHELRILVTRESLEMKIPTMLGFTPLYGLYPRPGWVVTKLPRNMIYSHLGWL